MSALSDFTGALGAVIRAYGPTVATVSGTVLMAVGGLVLDDASPDRDWMSWPACLLYVGFLAFAVGTFCSARADRAAEDLRSKVRDLTRRVEAASQDYRDRVLSALIEVANAIPLDTDARATIYSYDGESFVALARYSVNPRLRKPGRSTYPEDQGIIGAAWDQGTAEILDLPDPNGGVDAWLDAAALAGLGMPKSVAAKLEMKPRSLAACALTEPKGTDRVGIIVVESRHPDGVLLEPLVRVLRGQNGRNLQGFMADHRRLAPAPRFAHAKGF